MNKQMRNMLIVAVLGSAIVHVAKPLLKPIKKAVNQAVSGA